MCSMFSWCNTAVAYDLLLDDGVSFACNKESYSLKRSFRSITTKVRTKMNQRKAQGATPKVMLLNAATCMISLMEPFDGTFSEGAVVPCILQDSAPIRVLFEARALHW